MKRVERFGSKSLVETQPSTAPLVWDGARSHITASPGSWLMAEHPYCVPRA